MRSCTLAGTHTCARAHARTTSASLGAPRRFHPGAGACAPSRSSRSPSTPVFAEPLLGKYEAGTGVAYADFLNALWAVPGGTAKVLGGRCCVRIRDPPTAHRAHKAHGDAQDE